ncbi:Uncharacterized protein DAT39_010597, partial [Clarias magur]
EMFGQEYVSYLENIASKFLTAIGNQVGRRLLLSSISPSSLKVFDHAPECKEIGEQLPSPRQ